MGIEYLNLRKRTSLDRNVTRQSILTLVTNAFQAAYPAASEGCSFQDTVSGVDVVFPSGIMKSNLLAKFVPQLETDLEEFNNRGSSSTVFRLRAVFDVADAVPAQGASGAAGRLLGSSFLRLFVAALPRERLMAVVVSDEFYRDTEAPKTAPVGQAFRRARVRTNEDAAVTVWAYRYPVSES